MLVMIMADKNVNNMHEIYVKLGAAIIEMIVNHSASFLKATNVVLDMR